MAVQPNLTIRNAAAQIVARLENVKKVRGSPRHIFIPASCVLVIRGYSTQAQGSGRSGSRDETATVRHNRRWAQGALGGGRDRESYEEVVCRRKGAGHSERLSRRTRGVGQYKSDEGSNRASDGQGDVSVLAFLQ